MIHWLTKQPAITLQYIWENAASGQASDSGKNHRAQPALPRSATYDIIGRDYQDNQNDTLFAMGIRMGEMLEELQRLQVVELKLAAIRQQRSAKERKIHQHKRRIKLIEEKLENHNRSTREMQIRIDALSLDVNSREEVINRHRQALTKAKTNKEYAAILSAMNTEKADNTKIENQILQHMEEIQTLKDEGAKIEKERDKLSHESQNAESGLRKFESQSQKEQDEYQSQWEQHADRIEARALSAFNRVAHRHDGEALAAVIKPYTKRDDYVCSGCHMNISLEVVNALQTRDEIQWCGACGRILYIESSPATR